MSSRTVDIVATTLRNQSHGGTETNSRIRGIRDGDLQGLAALMNKMPLSALPERMATAEQFIEFARHLLPWIIGDPAEPLRQPTRSVHLRRDCANPLYAKVLTGEPRAATRNIVDLVPFGYDLDILEIRLLENYDVVDVFIVYEAPFTQQGMPKPLYFAESLVASPNRWRPFLDKILPLFPEPKDLEKERESTLSQRGWDLENSMRRMPWKLIANSGHRLAALVRTLARNPDTLFIQNDGDELVMAPVLYQLRHCVSHASLPWYTPSTSHKFNFEWFQHTYDRGRLGDIWVLDGLLHSPTIGNYLWAPGPTIHALAPIYASCEVPRYDLQDTSPELGPGAAVHLSSGAEPVGVWLKTTGTIESAGANDAVPSFILQAARDRRVTGAMLGSAVRPMCDDMHSLAHESQIDEETRDFLRARRPWTVQANPTRYPFIVPAAQVQRCRWHAGDRTVCSWTAASPTSPRHASCEELLKLV